MKNHADIATEPDAHYMRLALNEAMEALDEGDVPVGAVVVRGERVIGRGHNQRERLNDPTAHAEVEALRDAAKQRGRWRLDETILYVTLEPCAMCAGALVNARVAQVVFGAWDKRAGAVESLFRICDDARLNHRLQVRGGVLEAPCRELLQEFFRAKRARKKGES